MTEIDPNPKVNTLKLVEKKQPKLDLKYILDRCCANPENFKEWEEFDRQRMSWWHLPSEERKGEEPRYHGWMVYDITLHCVRLSVVARREANGGYTVKHILEQDH